MQRRMEQAAQQQQEMQFPVVCLRFLSLTKQGKPIIQGLISLILNSNFSECLCVHCDKLERGLNWIIDKIYIKNEIKRYKYQNSYCLNDFFSKIHHNTLFPFIIKTSKHFKCLCCNTDH